jgi:hypothetical protein
MKIEIDKAFAFIDTNGTDFQKSWLRSIVWKIDLDKTLSYIQEFQNPDGGFQGIDPDYKGTASSVTCTMIALKKLEYLNVRKHEIIDKIRNYLSYAQRREGFWDENNLMLQSSVPKWYIPRYKPNQIWYTNGLLRYIMSFFPEEKEMIHNAKNFLKENWNATKFRGYYHNNYMAIIGFSEWEDDLEQRIYKECMNNILEAIHTYDYYDAIWAIQSLEFLGLQETEDIVEKSLNLIMDSQMEDGGFKSLYGMNQRVEATIESIASLIHYNKIKLDECKGCGD